MADADIADPAQTVVMCDSNGYYRVTAQLDGLYNEAAIDARHNDGANFLFCDGHAKWQKQSEMTYPDGNTRSKYWTLAAD